MALGSISSIADSEQNEYIRTLTSLGYRVGASHAMSQLSLLKPTPRTTVDRFLFVISLELSIAKVAANAGRLFAKEQGWKGIARPPEVLHITLNDLGIFLDGLPPHLVKKLMAAGESVDFPQFDLTFDQIAQFGHTNGGQAIMVLRGGDGLQALMAFRQTLIDGMMWEGLPKQVQRGFTPHVTLQYGKGDFIGKAIETIGWTVREFSLVRSPQGETRHIPLATWRLKGGASAAMASNQAT
jgi:2'-5' RNA ligase